MFKEQFPLHNMPEYQRGDQQKAMDYVNAINFEIPETAAMMEKELEENNIKGLNYQAIGEGGMLAKDVFSTLADLKGKKLGAAKEQKAYEQLGLNVVNIVGADTYEALSRGVCDCMSYPSHVVVATKLYEITDCYMFDGLFMTGWIMAVNLDTWNSLPADIQGIFKEAAKEAEALSVAWEKTQKAECVKVMEENGMVVGTLPPEDTEALLRLNYDYDVEDMMALGAKVGKTEEVKVILKYVDEVIWGK